ncbi:citrate lyase acyl carrier protein [Martelella alba]|uniref:Citrate lyase acyl carrier protein n=1 Tax=Martelella alba TaxID=2590451 RepID=A0ABY2SR91_9HYPH|nr:citrate lyase acyl carrier protein [Martelella alba]TKI06549.1 citrate lyase acyl carrier protein [Martelella alba]
MKIVREALAGTFESSDLLVKIAPADGELNIVVNSEVMKQFGDRIRQVIDQTLADMGVCEGLIIVDDKGALDCVIRARIQTAVLRGAEAEHIVWDSLS